MRAKRLHYFSGFSFNIFFYFYELSGTFFSLFMTFRFWTFYITMFLWLYHSFFFWFLVGIFSAWKSSDSKIWVMRNGRIAEAKWGFFISGNSIQLLCDPNATKSTARLQNYLSYRRFVSWLYSVLSILLESGSKEGSGFD